MLLVCSALRHSVCPASSSAPSSGGRGGAELLYVWRLARRCYAVLPRLTPVAVLPPGAQEEEEERLRLEEEQRKKEEAERK